MELQLQEQLARLDELARHLEAVQTGKHRVEQEKNELSFQLAAVTEEANLLTRGM
jgi:hypothetical protein